MKIGIFQGLKDRLSKLFGRGVVDEQLFQELEEALIAADVSVKTTHALLQEMRNKVKKERLEGTEQVRQALQNSLVQKLQHEQAQLVQASQPPTLVVFIGVNGAGKTTSIAKLANQLKKEGKSVLVAAADTFRAAAIEQLEIWAQRANAQIVKSQPGADAAAVVFDAINAAKARGIDYVLADTAGRQHTKENLMNELKKVIKVSEKALGRPPDEVLLVLDGNTGQNAIRQAEEFSKTAGVTGAIITKLDGTSKGGAILSVKEELDIPIKFVGMGEKLEDLKPFKPEDFAKELID
jgi:fused signal recognition particle receptor